MFNRLSRIGDMNTKGGKILRGAMTVVAEGLPVGLHPSPISPHPVGPQHALAITVTASPSVIAEFMPVLRTSSVDSCGDITIQGSLSIVVP